MACTEYFCSSYIHLGNLSVAQMFILLVDLGGCIIMCFHLGIIQGATAQLVQLDEMMLELYHEKCNA